MQNLLRHKKLVMILAGILVLVIAGWYSIQMVRVRQALAPVNTLLVKALGAPVDVSSLHIANDRTQALAEGIRIHNPADYPSDTPAITIGSIGFFNDRPKAMPAQFTVAQVLVVQDVTVHVLPKEKINNIVQLVLNLRAWMEPANAQLQMDLQDAIAEQQYKEAVADAKEAKMNPPAAPTLRAPKGDARISAFAEGFAAYSVRLENITFVDADGKTIRTLPQAELENVGTSSAMGISPAATLHGVLEFIADQSLRAAH